MKNIFLVLFLGFVLLISSAQSVNAQGGATQRSPTEVGAARDNYETNGDVNSVILSSDMVSNDMYNVSCMIGMVDACTNDPNKVQAYYNRSFIGAVNNTVALLYINQPANTSKYIAYLGQKAGIVTPAYAQGLGFTGLSPILTLWTGFRNIAYGFLIIVTGAIGFMILFRMKIDPRTVITIQSALPRIVVTLIAITFSYAIAGILIDLMYIVMFLIFTAISTAIGGIPQFQNALGFFTGGSTADLFSAVFAPSGASLNIWSSEGAVGDIAAMIGDTNIRIINGIIGAVLTPGGPFQIGKIGMAIGGFAAGGNSLIHLLVALAFLFAFIRILFTLLNAYIGILVAIIFGPLQLMFGAIPNNDSISSWFKNMIANIAVFPVVSTLLLLAILLTNQIGKEPQFWRPPGLAGSFVGATASRGIGGIIGMGMVFIIPNIAGALKEMLKAKSPLPIGAGTAASPITSVYGTVMGGASNLYYMSQMKSQMKNMLPFGLGGPKE